MNKNRKNQHKKIKNRVRKSAKARRSPGVKTFKGSDSTRNFFQEGVGRPTREQSRVMKQLGFKSLSKAKSYAWYRQPMNGSIFRHLWIDTNENLKENTK